MHVNSIPSCNACKFYTVDYRPQQCFPSGSVTQIFQEIDQFGNQVYQYKIGPYDFKNSLSAFIRALDMVRGDGLEDNVMTCG